MTAPTPAIRLARRLLVAATSSVEASPDHADPALRVIENLRGPLTKLVGATGFSSLLAKALLIARRQAPSLDRLRVQPDGSVIGSDEVQHDLTDGGEVLVAEFLDLLITFIGEAMTVTLIREVWPDASLDATPDTEEKS